MDEPGRPNRYVNIRIDLAAIRHNFNRARAAAPGRKIFSVVKADAYGHGAQRVVAALQDSDGFAVANVAEGVSVRQVDTHKPVLVLQGFHSRLQLKDCCRSRLWPVIHNLEHLRMLESADPAELSGLVCWLKVDTGMGRLGIKPEQLAEVYDVVRQSPVAVGGVMTHLAAADSPRDMSTDRQLKVFRSLQWPDRVAQSVANSAAILSRKDSHYDWLRPGIMLYGANPFQSGHEPQQTEQAAVDVTVDADFGLQPAMRVTAPVIAIRDFKRGDRIGYGGLYECSAATRVAVVAAGYGDGYPRTIPEGTCVMLGNRRCPIVGRVSMDSMSVDVTGLSVAPPLEYPVTLWGHAGLRVDEIAHRTGTIPYELLCSIRGRRSWLDPSTETNIRRISDDISS